MERAEVEHHHDAHHPDPSGQVWSILRDEPNNSIKDNDADNQFGKCEEPLRSRWRWRWPFAPQKMTSIQSRPCEEISQVPPERNAGDGRASPCQPLASAIDYECEEPHDGPARPFMRNDLRHETRPENQRPPTMPLLDDDARMRYCPIGGSRGNWINRPRRVHAFLHWEKKSLARV